MNVIKTNPDRYTITLIASGGRIKECSGLRGRTCLRDLQILAAAFWGEDVEFCVFAPEVGWDDKSTSRGAD